jgi:outer membrane protein assembly factor BamB
MNHLSPVRTVLTVLCWGLLTGVAAAQSADASFDWPNWRGPEQNGISRELGLVDEWDPNTGKNLLWKREDMGTMSTPIVMNGRLYFLAPSFPGTKKEGEKVVCLDAQTGETLWENVFGVYLTDAPGERTAWTSRVVGDPETGNVYALGLCGYFQCIDGQSGQTKWAYSMHEVFGLLATYGGRTNVPIIYEDMVLISAVVVGWGDMARPAHRFMAFDKRTGEMRWFAGTRPNPYDTTYSTPVATVLGGQAAIVFGSGDGAVWALQPRTGKQIWRYQLSPTGGLNVAPLVAGDTVYMAHSEENMDLTSMGSVVAINGALEGDVTQSGHLWQVKEIVAGRSSPLLVENRLYLVDDRGKLWILDPKDGKQIGTTGTGRFNAALGTGMRSNLLYADGRIYACTLDCRFYVLRPTDKGVDLFPRRGLRLPGENFGSPIASRGRIYLPTTLGMYCIGSRDHQPQLDPKGWAKPPAERPVEEDAKVAQVQVIPCEVMLAPGGKQKFNVRLFNARGQSLPDAPVEFSVDGGATINSDGLLDVGGDNSHHAVIVTARLGEVEGKARVRVIPPLPWKFDFQDGQIPITWNGMRNRHVPKKLEDGNWVIEKLDAIPVPGGFTKLGTRSQGFMGPDTLHDYTVQADVMGTIKPDRALGDIGITAQRYTLELFGLEQKLEITDWPTQKRAAKRIDFAWQPNVWYTMKLQASNEGDQAVLRGKVWPRDAQEPAEWTIELADEKPNRTGSPGFHGTAREPGSPFYIDNVLVTPNASAAGGQ